MIARLRGTLVDRAANRVIVECAGVGYTAQVSVTTLAALPSLGGDVTLRVHTHFAQDKFSLYAFATSEEQDLFELLITVDGLGPAAALLILSGGPPATVAQMIAREDKAGLTSIKGIGKKKADKIVFMLQEQCEMLLLTWGASGSPNAEPSRTRVRAPILDEVAGALVGLGYKKNEADKVVGDLAVAQDATVESLLREALQSM